jgi:hypothetical protein
MPTSSTGSIREFGGEKLVASGEDEAMAARQAAYFLGVVNAAEHEWRRSRQVAVLQEAQREHDNLRAAWHWAEDRGEPSLAQELAKALEWLAGAELDLFQVRSAVADYERLLAQARERGDRPRELDALLGLAQAHYVLALDNQIAGRSQARRSARAISISRPRRAPGRSATPRPSFAFWCAPSSSPTSFPTITHEPPHRPLRHGR